MSIKKKKRINKSKNAYRWTRIEEYLISQGYVLKDSSKSYRVWVDCVGNGRDIAYSLDSVSSFGTPAPGDSRDLYGRIPEGTYNVLCTHSVVPHHIFRQCKWIRQAVEASRDSARW